MGSGKGRRALIEMRRRRCSADQLERLVGLTQPILFEGEKAQRLPRPNWMTCSVPAVSVSVPERLIPWPSHPQGHMKCLCSHHPWTPLGVMNGQDPAVDSLSS